MQTTIVATESITLINLLRNMTQTGQVLDLNDEFKALSRRIQGVEKRPKAHKSTLLANCLNHCAN